MSLLQEILFMTGYIPMIILQYYMSIIILPIIVCSYIIWKYKSQKKVMIKNILFHLSGLLSYILTKILSSKFIDIDYSIENILIHFEAVLVVLFGAFGILLIIDIINYNREHKKEKKQILTRIIEDLKSPFGIMKIAIILIIIGSVVDLPYMKKFMRNSYEEYAAIGNESYTVTFRGLSLSWRDSTGNEKYCEDMTYFFNPINHTIDLYCFYIYEESIKIIKAEPEKLIIKDSHDGKYTHLLKNNIEPEPKDNPDYLIGRKFKNKDGITYYFKNQTEVEIEYKNKKNTLDYLLIDFNDNYLEIDILNDRFNYDRTKNKIIDLKEIK